MFRRLSRPLSASAALGAAAYIQRRRDDALCRKDDPLTDYSVGGVLGEGAYAVVKLVTSNLTGERFALKVIDKAFTLPDAMEKELQKKRQLRQEIAHCKEILRQANKVKSQTQRRSSGGTNFEALSYSRARGIQRVKLTGLFPHIQSPASYNLGLL